MGTPAIWPGNGRLRSSTSPRRGAWPRKKKAEEKEEGWFQAETLRLTGDVLLATGDPAAAEATYGEALALAQQQSAKLWELRAATSLARLWRDQGNRSEARELLAPIYSWFTEGFDTQDLKDGKALLDELRGA